MILDLPYDIREIILKELLVSPRPLEELPYIYHQQNKAAQRTMPTIPGLSGQVLRVCQLLREEGTHILYGDNVACIRLRVYNSQYPEVSILGSIPVLGKTWLNHRLQGNEDCGRDHDLRRLAGRFTKLSILLSCAPQEDEPTGSWATMLLSMFCEWLSSVPGFDQKQIEIEVGADLFPQLEVPLETLTVLRGRNITMKGLSEDTCNRWAQSFRAGTSSPFIHRMGFIVKDFLHNQVRTLLEPVECIQFWRQAEYHLSRSDVEGMREHVLKVLALANDRFSKAAQRLQDTTRS